MCTHSHYSVETCGSVDTFTSTTIFEKCGRNKYIYFVNKITSPVNDLY